MHWSADVSSQEADTSYIAKESCFQDGDSLEMNEGSLHVHCERYQWKMIS